MKHAVVIGAVAGLTAVLVLVLLSVLVFVSMGGPSHHVVELDPSGEPTYTVP